MLVRDILAVSSNISVKTRSIGALLLSIVVRSEIRVTTGLTRAVVVLHVRGTHTVI